VSLLRIILLYIKTIYFLKPVQIFNRLTRKFSSLYIVENRPYKIKNFPKLDWDVSNKKILQNNTFIFLNDKKSLNFPRDWNNPNYEKLWTYNLHYFDGLLCSSTEIFLKRDLIHQWIEDNKLLSGIGWEPYPISKRSVNWIKYLSSNIEEINEEITDSLVKQIRFLNNNIEYHILGNHILENARALIFAGLFFDGIEPKKWLTRGIKILRLQINEQILNDGAHFELSPMYHSIVLEILIDIYKLSSINNSDNDLKGLNSLLKINIIKMADWLQAMLHQDGEISYFNDAALGIALHPSAIFKELNSLINYKPREDRNGVTYLEDSGYIRISCKDSILIFDAAEIGASYQPGHGHADALSFELSVFGSRLIVNSGTSNYENSSRRHFERSTIAHSTLTINELNSSEVWSSFRVGARAKIKDIHIKNENDIQEIKASHNGYRKLERTLLHTREIKKIKNSLIVIDRVNNQIKYDLKSRFHLSPDININFLEGNNTGELITPDKKIILFTAYNCNIVIEDNLYAKGFGLLEGSSTICLKDFKQDESMISFNWQ